MMVRNNKPKLFSSKNWKIKYAIKTVQKKHLKAIIEKDIIFKNAN